MSTVDTDVEVPGGPADAARPAGGAAQPAAGPATAGPATGATTAGATTAGADPAGAELTGARLARVGDIEVRRLLPLRHRRSVGAWCFVDHYGPLSVDGAAGMQVPPHPHIGLQTVTWLMEGNVLHRDSLGSEQMIRPGQLSLMTAGRGIAHSEESPLDHDPGLHGVQLWLALPEAHRQGRESVSVAARAESSLFLLGGEPLGEPLLMWWNFVARTPEEIIAAARDWGEASVLEKSPVTGARLLPPRRWTRSASPGAPSAPIRPSDFVNHASRSRRRYVTCFAGWDPGSWPDPHRPEPRHQSHQHAAAW